MAVDQLFIQSIQHAPLVETEDQKVIINPTIPFADQFTFDLEVNPYGGIQFVGYTPRLKLESLPIGIQSWPDYLKELQPIIDLYGNPEVMAKYADGKTRSPEAVLRLLHMFTGRWHNGDPYSMVRVFDRKTNEFLGTATLGHCEFPGTSELAGVFKPEHWNDGVASEAFMCLFAVVPYLRANGYEITNWVITTDPSGKKITVPITQELSKIIATGRLDNYTFNILKHYGFVEIEKNTDRYGASEAPRSLFYITATKIEDIVNNTAAFQAAAAPFVAEPEPVAVVSSLEVAADLLSSLPSMKEHIFMAANFKPGGRL